MKHPLDYMPPVHRRTRRRWPALIAAQSFLLVLFVIAVGNGSTILLLFSVGLGGVLLWVLARDLWSDRRWEYVLEGRDLRFRRPQDRGWGTIRIDDVEAILDVELNESCFYLEFVFLNGRRLYVEAEVFGLFGDTGHFARALEQVRPDLDIGAGDASRCPGCDQVRIGWNAPRCPGCGEPLSRRVPRIPAEGAPLPKGL
ncbi:MAG TPA: hypothetical protein VF796_06225, partial [Humisphaera sp.]